jgi:hypothetical protein
MSAIDPQFSISAQQSDIANAVVSSSARRAQPASASLVNIVSQSSSQGQGGQVLINLGNTPNTFIKNGTVYLRFKLTATTTAIAGADQWIRSGSATCAATSAASAAPASGNNYQAPNVGSWSSVISRLTISAGSNVLEQINNYNVFHEAMLLHTSGNYGLQDMQLLEGGQCSASAYSADTWKVAASAAAGQVRSAYVTIPLFAGVFNAQDNKDFPLGLLQGGIQIVADLASDAMTFTATDCAPTLTVSEASLSYEAVQVSGEYMNALRAELAQSGQLFQMPFVSALVMNVGALATLDVTYGVGLASVKAVLFTNKNTPAITAPKYSLADSCNQLRIYADGKLQNMFQISDVPTFYAELNRALGSLASRTSTSGVLDMFSGYASKYFYGGLSFNKFNEGGLTMSGTPCSQLQFHLERTLTAAGQTYILIFYDAILAASPLSGESSIVR